MMIEIIKNTILDGRKCGLTDGELSAKIIDRIVSLQICPTGWFNSDTEYTSLLNIANSKIINPIPIYEITSDMFKECADNFYAYLHDIISIDDIEDKISQYNDILKIKLLQHLSTLMLNVMINSDSYGGDKKLIDNAAKCRKEIYDIIIELRKNK